MIPLVYRLLHPKKFTFCEIHITQTHSEPDNWLKASLTMQLFGHPVTVSKVNPIFHNRGPGHYLLLEEWNPV
jgi:hypothetical protein